MQRANSFQKQQTFQCFCQKEIDFSELKNHIENCKQYHGESPFYKEFMRLPLDKLQEVHFTAIRSEFQLYIDIIDKHMKKFGQVNESLPKLENKNSSFRHGLSKIGITGVTNQIQCQLCHNPYDLDKIVYLNNCNNMFCKGCLAKQIQQEFIEKSGELGCKLCGRNIGNSDIEQVIGQEKLEELNIQLINIKFNIVGCIKCKSQGEFQPGKVGVIKDQNGNQISQSAQNHYANNRFTCPDCKTEQCRTCHETPYHIGYNCEEYKKFKNAKHCRYCDQEINGYNPMLSANLQDICQSNECMEKAVYACEKVLACGHNCCGVKGEKKCLPCLKEDCEEGKKQRGNNVSGEDYCNYCFIEGLNQAPVIQSSCGHMFHYQCVKKRLTFKWTSPRIIFTFCLCPLCKEWMEFPAESDLSKMQIENSKLLEEIQQKSLQRLKHEERLKDPKLVDPKSPFFNKPQDYAMTIYAYYECYKCKKSYFGGHKDCQQAIDDGQRDFNPKDLVCANCCDIPIENCKKHGKDFIEFKCKFCCSVSQWFCWGTTHFCDSCHKKQCSGDYVSKYTKEQLPKCPGKQKCPLKMDHKPNGEECSLGCMMCRNAQENAASHNF